MEPIGGVLVYIYVGVIILGVVVWILPDFLGQRKKHKDLLEEPQLDKEIRETYELQRKK